MMRINYKSSAGKVKTNGKIVEVVDNIKHQDAMNFKINKNYVNRYCVDYGIFQLIFDCILLRRCYVIWTWIG